MKIAFVYSEGRTERLAAAACGQLPSEFFYGALELSRLGHDVRYDHVNNQSRSALAGLIDSRLGYGMPVRFRLENFLAAQSHLAEWNEADCVIAANSTVGMSLGLLRKLGRLRKPVVAIHCGVVNWTHSKWRQQISRPLFNEQEVVLFAQPEAEAMREVFHLSDHRLHVCPFGVDVGFWEPLECQREFIFAVGNDSRRDFDSYALAAGKIDYRFRLLSRLKLKQPAPANLEHTSGQWSQSVIDDAELRSWYQQSLGVVIPLTETIQPSGQSVALQAMACGRPVIMTKTRGYWLHPDFKDGEHLLLVNPDSPDELTRAIASLVNDPTKAEAIGRAGRQLMLRHYSISEFARNLQAVCQQSI